jgi:acetyltransferase-like isoleucine patch superfamily enzyme
MNLYYRLLHAAERRYRLKKTEMMKSQLKFCGRNVFIDPSCNILVPAELEIGDNSSVSSFTTIYAPFGVKIGRDVLISSNCGISSINHIQNSRHRRLDPDDRGQFSKPVIIGDNVWIGMNVCVLPGVIIGENSIIGAGSVVTKNIPENEVWVGNPARRISVIDLKQARCSTGTSV